MDAFAVSIIKGLCVKDHHTFKLSIVLALFFGGFQFLMPLIGWYIGQLFSSFPLHHWDNWIAFLVLTVIGVKMILEAGKVEACDTSESFRNKYPLNVLLGLAVATSIDALAVGVSFSFLHYAIMTAALLFGAITFVISMIGVVIGYKVGLLFAKRAEQFGGIVLVLIGLKILFS